MHKQKALITLYINIYNLKQHN